MIILETQGSRLSMKTRGVVEAPRVKSVRGKVTEFSRRSRKRLMDMLASFDMTQALGNRPAIFITLTYGQEWPESDVAKAHLKAFDMRIRRFAPEASGFWRVELQERGAPHFHLIFFNLPYLAKEDMQNWWLEIVGTQYADNSKDEPRCPFTRIEAIASSRKAFRYVSKYVAKSERSDSGFNHSPYQHGSGWQGRFWGIINKDNLPFAALFEYVMENDELSNRVFWQFKRLMAKKFSGIWRGKAMTGATLYIFSQSGIDQWKEAFIRCVYDALEEI